LRGDSTNTRPIISFVKQNVCLLDHNSMLAKEFTVASTSLSREINQSICVYAKTKKVGYLKIL
jgi:hypothetical protein